MANKVAREFKASDGSIELLLTEEITQMTAERLISQLSAYKGQNINLSIYSQGGNAQAAFGIYDYITDATNNLHITARVYGMAASGAMIIAAGCEKRVIGDSSFAMAHYAYPADPEAKLTESEQAQLDAMNERQIELFQKITGKGRVEIKHMLDEGMGMSADQAVAFGLFNGKIEQAKLAALVTKKTMAEPNKMRAIKVSAADALKAIASGEIQVPEDQFTVSEADKVTALDAQIATLTAERDALKAEKEAAEKKVTEAEADKATELEAKAKVEGELMAAQEAVGKFQAAIEALKKNPMVAQVMPDGTSVVIPGSEPDAAVAKKTKEEERIDRIDSAWEQAKKNIQAKNNPTKKA